MNRRWYQKVTNQAAIIVGISALVAALVTGVFKDGSKVDGDPFPARGETIPVRNDSLTADSDTVPVYARLSTTQLRHRIQILLRQDSLAAAVGLVEFIKSEGDKQEEYEHLADYCLKNGRLSEAVDMANLVSSAAARERLMTRVALERLKTE